MRYIKIDNIIIIISICFSCFTTNAYAALAGVVFPALLCLMVVGIVFIQTFQVAPQWQAYDDVYRGRYNKHGEQRDTSLSFYCVHVPFFFKFNWY